MPIWVLERHKPGHVGLIASTAPQSQSAAEEIRQHADRNGMQTHELQILEDPDDPNEAKIKTKALIEQMRHYGLNSIAVDMTGGKVPMSLGAFMAAEESGVSTLYVTAQYNAELKKPDLKKADIRCISKPE